MEDLIVQPLQNLQIMASYLEVKKWKWHIKAHKLLMAHEMGGDISDSEEESVFDTESDSDNSSIEDMRSD
jgi:hypothetical protein